jgi:hypothetical protein
MGRENGAARIVGFKDFREEVESGCATIGEVEEGDILGVETMEGSSV